MAGKKTTVKKLATSSDESFLTDSSEQTSNLRKRIMHSAEGLDTQKVSINAKEVQTAVEEGIKTGLSNRNKIESTEDVSPSSNKNNKDTQATQEETKKLLTESQKNYSLLVNTLNKMNSGATQGAVSSSLVLGADAISPGFGKAVQLAISSGIGKSIFGAFNKSVMNLLGKKEDKSPEKKAEESAQKQQELAKQQIESTEDTNKKLDSIHDTLTAKAKSKETDSATVAKENKKEAREREAMEHTAKLFKGVRNSSKKVAKSVSGIKKWLTGFSLAALAAYLFNDQFRATVNAHIKRIFSGTSTMAKAVVTGVLSLIGAGLAGPLGTVTKALFKLGMFAGSVVVRLGSWVASLGVVKDAIGWISSKFKGLSSKVIGWVKSPLQKAGAFFKTAGFKALGYISSAMSALKDKVIGIASAAKNKVLKSLSGLKNLASRAGTWIKSAFMNAGKKFIGFITSLKNKFLGILSKIPGFGSLAKGAKNMLSKAGGSLKKLGGKLFSKVGGKAGLKTVGKKLPGVGLLVGAGLALNELRKGNFKGAGSEAFSSVLGQIPLIGTAASLAWDATVGNKLTNQEKKEVIVKEKRVSEDETKKETSIHQAQGFEVSARPLHTDTNNHKRPDMEKPVKVIVVKDENKSETPEMPAFVNTLPSNPAMRPYPTF